MYHSELITDIERERESERDWQRERERERDTGMDKKRKDQLDNKSGGNIKYSPGNEVEKVWDAIIIIVNCVI